MPIFTDQLNRTIELPSPPRRIVSLVPSQTELLWTLGLEEEVVGITKFCVHPESWFRNKQRIGGTKTLHLNRIKALEPDLIIANKEENVRDQVEALAERYPVWISDVNTLEEALAMIRAVGRLTGKADEAENIATRVNGEYGKLLALSRPVRTAYLIWKDPYMTVGHDTFIHDQLARCGFRNVFGNQARYPAIDLNQLQAADCELVMLSSEPYPFKQKHIDELQAYLPAARIMLVDGEFFSWYGSRLLGAPSYFTQLMQQAQMGQIM